MAQNLPQREKSKRQPQNNKKYTDFVCSQGSTTNKNNYLPCKGCDLNFKDKRVLLLHQARCITVKVNVSNQGSSFFNDHFSNHKKKINSTSDTAEKILPASQPLGEYRQQGDQPLSYAKVVSLPNNANPTPASQPAITTETVNPENMKAAANTPASATEAEEEIERAENDVLINVAVSRTQITLDDPSKKSKKYMLITLKTC